MILMQVNQLQVQGSQQTNHLCRSLLYMICIYNVYTEEFVLRMVAVKYMKIWIAFLIHLLKHTSKFVVSKLKIKTNFLVFVIFTGNQHMLHNPQTGLAKSTKYVVVQNLPRCILAASWRVPDFLKLLWFVCLYVCVSAPWL